MNEELKIIISAVTDKARKGIQDVKGELGGMEKQGSKAGSGVSTAFAAIGKAAGVAVVAVGAVVAVVGALVSALTNLSKNTRQFREEQARLNAAFASAGGSAKSAEIAYNGLYRFMGDTDAASEAAQSLARITTNERELMEWTTALQGAYAKYGKGMPTETLAEAAAETIALGKVTGDLSRLLTEAGVSEDAFNASLASCTTMEERQALVRNTLNGLMGEAALLYEKNNAEIIAQNEAQARLDATTARLGKTCQPLQTALTNLSAALLTALEPAINVVASALTWLINVITSAINWVLKLFSLLTGKKVSVDIGGDMGSASKNISKASSGAGGLAKELGGASKAAEKLKRTTAGFDELNVMANPNSGSSGGGGAGAGGGGIGGIGDFGGGTIIDTSGITEPLDKAGKKIEEFVGLAKRELERLQGVFAPTIAACKDFGVQIVGAVKESLPLFLNGLQGFIGGFVDLGKYLYNEFIPEFTNAFSEYMLPVYGDMISFGILELAKAYEYMGEMHRIVTNDVIIPTLDLLKEIYIGLFEGINSAWEENGGQLLSSISEFHENIRKNITDLHNGIVKPILDKLIQMLKRVWNEGLQPLWTEIVLFVTEVGNCLLVLYNKHIQPIVNLVTEYVYPVVADTIGAILDVFGDFFIGLSNIASGIIQSIRGIVQFLTGVFSGDWKKAWEGIQNIFSGIWKAIANALKLPVNSIIGTINVVLAAIASTVNTAIKAINKIKVTIPDWVPSVGGKSIGFNLSTITAPKIPALATGGVVIGETLARMGEGGKKEAVLPLEQNTEWMDMLADKLAAKTNAPTKIVLMLNEKELGWASINSINSITQQTGQLNLRLV